MKLITCTSFKRVILISVAQNSAGIWLPAHPSSRAILISVAQNSAGYWLPAHACLVAYSGTSIQSLVGNVQAGVSIRCGFFRHWSTDNPFLIDG